MMMMMDLIARKEAKPVISYISPYVELNAGLWTLFVAATVFLGLRIWCKLNQRHGLWYDDHILIVSWIVLLVNNSLTVREYATGYILKDTTEKWDDRMHILINITSCGMLIGQAWTKTAFGVTLLRLSRQRWQDWFLWFCIITMNLYMIIKVIFQWAKVCGKKSYDNYYRLDFCLDPTFRENFKEGGNIYNIIMDFVFALFPWLITWDLDMRRFEKIGLCITMSLGMLVAIESAVRVSWKSDGNNRDEFYIWRNAMSQIWYNSEITGTIIVQCIPVLRPLLRNFHRSWSEKRSGSMSERGSFLLGKLSASLTSRLSGRLSAKLPTGASKEYAEGDPDTVALKQLPDTPAEADYSWKKGSYSPSTAIDAEWPRAGNQRSRKLYESGRSLDDERDRTSSLYVERDIEDGLAQPPRTGLSPPPPRR